MKAAILLIAVFGCACSHDVIQDGDEYVFDVETTSTVGTMDYATFSSGFSYKYRVRMQIDGRTMNFKMDDMKFSQYVGAHDSKEHPYENTNYEASDKEVPPFSVTLDNNGLFKKMTIPDNLGTMQINTFKGFATIFQLNKGEIKKGNLAFTSEENSLQGTCNVAYTVSNRGILKSVAHMSDCKEKPLRLYNTYGLQKCHSDHGEHPSSLANMFYGIKQRSDGRRYVHYIKASTTYIEQMFEEEGQTFMAHTNFTAQLVELKSSSGDISPSGSTKITDLKYEFHDQEDKWNVDRELKNPVGINKMLGSDPSKMMEKFKDVLDRQKSFMEDMKPDNMDLINEAHRYGTRHLAHIAATLGYDQIMSLAGTYLNDDSAEGKMKASIFMGIISSAGSTASAMAVRDMVMKDMVDDKGAARMITSVPFHMRKPNTQLVKEFEQLLQKDMGRLSTMAAKLSIPHLVRRVCMQNYPLSFEEMYKCSKEFGSVYAKKYWDDYKATDKHDEKSDILTQMANLGVGGVASLLEPLIMGKMEKCPMLRNKAMFAAAPELVIRKTASGIAKRLFLNIENPYSVRINALEMLFQSEPSAADMSAIVVMLYREKNYEVLNYAFTLFERVSSSVNNCHAFTTHLAKFYYKYMKQYSNYNIDWALGVSKTWHRQYFKKKYGYGSSNTFYVVGSEKSTIPVALGFQLKTQFMDRYETTGLGVFLQITGVSKAIVKKFKTTDPATWKLDDLKKVMDDMNIRERPDQPISVSVLVVVKDIAVLSRTYDESDLKPGGKISTFLEQYKNKKRDGMIEYNRLLKLGGIIIEFPSGMGHPHLLTTGLSTTLSISAKTNKGSHRGMLYAEAEYDIRSFSQGYRTCSLINPFRKSIYTIVQDRVYSANFPRKVVAGANPIKREVKLSLSRPDVDNPMRMLMHSMTAVTQRDFSNKDSLQNNCPSCKNIAVISKGPDAAKGRAIIDRESTKMGGMMKAEYFDCEMDISKKNTFAHALGAFLPYNKSPKTLGTSISMGLRQIRAFFMYFPKSEKCGLNIQYSQSRTNPVKEVEITVRGTAETTSKIQFFEGKKYMIKAYIKAKGDSDATTRAYKINVAYEFGPNKISNKLKLQVQRNAVPAVGLEPLLICMAYESKYPDFPKKINEFNPDKTLSNKGKAMIQYGRASSCSDNDGEIRVTFDHQTTDYAKEEIKNTWYYKQCMKQKNGQGWSNGNDLPVTEACYRVIHDATAARKYSWHIEFVKLTERVKRVLGKIKTAIKAGLFPYWDVDADNLGADGEVGPFLNVEAEFKDNEKTVDISLETRLGKEEFTDVPLRTEWTKRMRNLRFGGPISKLYFNRIINPCTVSLGDIQTNDNITLAYNPPTCWTLASASCGPVPQYAVFMKKSGSGMAVNVYLGGHLVELTPDGGVKVNGESKSIEDKGEYNHRDLFMIYRWGTTYNVYSSMRLMVLYDRSYVEIIPAPSTKGQHCGICGNYNRNPFDELTGKNEQKMASVQEFVDEWKQKC